MSPLGKTPNNVTTTEGLRDKANCISNSAFKILFVTLASYGKSSHELISTEMCSTNAIGQLPLSFTFIPESLKVVAVAKNNGTIANGRPFDW